MVNFWLGVNNNKIGVSEIVGTMLLLLISIGLFSVVYLSVYSISEPVPAPSVNIIGTIDLQNNQIVFYHLGGNTISGNGQLIIQKGEIEKISTLSSYIGKEWKIGESLVLPIINDNDDYIAAKIVDHESNSVISNAILQRG